MSEPREKRAAEIQDAIRQTFIEWRKQDAVGWLDKLMSPVRRRVNFVLARKI